MGTGTVMSSTSLEEPLLWPPMTTTGRGNSIVTVLMMQIWGRTVTVIMVEIGGTVATVTKRGVKERMAEVPKGIGAEAEIEAAAEAQKDRTNGILVATKTGGEKATKIRTVRALAPTLPILPVLGLPFRGVIVPLRRDADTMKAIVVSSNLMTTIAVETTVDTRGKKREKIACGVTLLLQTITPVEEKCRKADGRLLHPAVTFATTA
mmetsp:Transcript_2448/g.5648  ORF Transcript_2448/g.5648 Transcript_2448/m.5648 type:complete len:207 (+) Transcript_2448:446-1066(+)